jgi:hypothetical protein
MSPPTFLGGTEWTISAMKTTPLGEEEEVSPTAMTVLPTFPMKPTIRTLPTVQAGSTVPTSVREDAMHAAPMRLDYLLATHALARHWAGRGATVLVVVDQVTDAISDHYPLRLVFNSSGQKQQHVHECGP